MTPALELGETLEHEGVKYVLVQLTVEGAGTAASNDMWQRIVTLLGVTAPTMCGGCTTCVTRHRRTPFDCTLCSRHLEAFVVRADAIPYLALEGVLV